MRVTFRAQFRGPKALLNPSGFNWPNPPVQTVEVFRRGSKPPFRWYAREADSRYRTELTALGKAPTHGTMKDAVAEAFNEQLSKWAMFDLDGKPLNEALIQEDPDGNFRKNLPTHVAALSQVGMTGNEYRTACNVVVGAAQIRSKRGQQAPDCLECRKAWEQVKEELRLKQA